MILGIPKETQPSEKRVAIAPDNIAAFAKLGYEVVIENGAGEQANLADSAFTEAGARIVDNATSVWGESDLILKVTPPNMNEAEMIKEGATLISFVYPARNEELLNKLGERKINLLAMDCVPRISRAQSMDALSSMANVAGYRA
ncbi:MAG: NAD(P)(+) transhydrogenase (Re/Si-specific) subunit alpha, partial [Opitutae bacterium]